MSNHVLKHLDFEKSSNYFAILCGEEFYLLILLLNRSLGLSLKRTRKDLTFAKTKASFMAYGYEDKKNGYSLSIFNNVSKSVTKDNQNNTLFGSDIKDFLLLPELSSVDFILKYSGDGAIFAGFLTKIKSISEVVSIYEIPEKKLKSKENLTFEY